MEKYWLKQMKEELKVESDQLREKLEDQNTEIQLLKEGIRELSKRAATKDQPHELACAFTHRWSKEGKTVNYDYLLSDHTSSGDGVLNTTTGVYTCQQPGHYTVSYSGTAVIKDGQKASLHLYQNGVVVPASMWYSFASGISGQYLQDQGSKTLILYMEPGDFLELRTDYGFFNGEIFTLTFCISLTSLTSSV